MLPCSPHWETAEASRHPTFELTEESPMLGSFVGKLLVASPSLIDGNFSRTVVLVCVHDENGAFGLVLNRPLPVTVPEALPEWAGRAAEPEVMFAGGPVQTSLVTGLGFSRMTPSEDWTPVARGIGLVDLGRGPEGIAPSIERLRLFAGYAGWGANQLEFEVAREDWFVVDAYSNDPFSARPRDLWRDVLRRQADPLVMYSTFPLDPLAN